METKICKRCGACCRTITFQFMISTLESKEFYLARGFDIKKYVVTAEVDHLCPQLTLLNKCKIHDHKPIMCRDSQKHTAKELLPDGCVFK